MDTLLKISRSKHHQGQFSDITLDLRNEKYYTCTKEGSIPLDVHKESNDPPSILENIPESSNKRLSDIASDRQRFDNATPKFQDFPWLENEIKNSMTFQVFHDAYEPCSRYCWELNVEYYI